MKKLGLAVFFAAILASGLNAIGQQVGNDSAKVVTSAASLPDLKPDANGKLSQEQMQQLFRVVADKDLENDKRQRDYTYIERDEEHKLDGKGQVKSTEAKTYEVLEIYGEQVQRLIEKDDKALNAKDAAKEEEKIQKVIDKRKNESEDARRKREQKEEQERENDRKFVREVADAYNFQLVGIETLGGREAWVIDAEPRPGYEPHTKEAKFLPKFHGRVWIDKDDDQLTKMDVECIDTVSIGLFLARIHKGSRIVYEQIRVNDEVWLPKHLSLNADVRLALLKNFNVNLEQAYHDYKKFRATARIVGVGEVQEKQATPFQRQLGCEPEPASTSSTSFNPCEVWILPGATMATQLTPFQSDVRGEAFPVLSAEQINRIRPLAKVRNVNVGEILFEPGDLEIPFFVLLSGGMEILQPDMEGERPVVSLNAGEFSGEITMISGRRGLMRGRVTKAGEFLQMTSNQLRTLVARDAELSEIFMRAFILRRVWLINRSLGNVILLGSRHSAKTLRLREFLTRNGHPHTYVDLDTDATAQQMLDHFQVTIQDIPVVICNNRTVLRGPSIQELARCLGLNAHIATAEVRDVVIVGAGPSGLAAAVYGASEGLDVLVIEAESPGGQAGSSSRIENYLGFPMGITGQELAGRAAAQAQKFGAKVLIANNVTRLNCDRRPYELVVDCGQVIRARTVVIASGAQYKKPKIENLVNFEGQGIYYGATYIEAQLCGNEPAIVVGGGNSAGQAAVYLSQTASKVHMLVRSNQLSDTMSRYLIQRIEENPGIELHYGTEIVGLEGNAQLERVTWRDKNNGETSTHDIRYVFIMAGGSPRTEWLNGCVAMDDKGFILTGRDLAPVIHDYHWPLPRNPQMLETSLPGVFAVGDVRAGNVKRVASAVGEGSIAISLVHRVLAEL